MVNLKHIFSLSDFPLFLRCWDASAECQTCVELVKIKEEERRTLRNLVCSNELRGEMSIPTIRYNYRLCLHSG